ncbi:serine hydrolase [Psychroserpens sp.]|uniref:serine hydrolase n=1 Tax=Psychroserpens sp. TaxID=2020870 RepID=UPI003859C6AE
MKLFITAIVSLLLFGCNSNETQLNNTIINGETGHYLDSILTPYVQELRKLTDNSAGLAIGITKGEEIIYARTFGYADIDQGLKVNLNSQFHLASVSKPFSALAVAKLIQENKINLDDLLIDYIPEFKMKGEGYNNITIKHILTHTSGIPRNIKTDDWIDSSYGNSALDENIKIVQKLELDFEPGTKFSYSNSAFDILGIVISRVSGMPFHKYLEKVIFKPVGMQHTSMKKPIDSLPLDWVNAHSHGLETQTISPYPYNERVFPSSGIVTSILDMCKWGQLHINQGNIDGKTIIDEKYFNMVVSPKQKTPWGDNIGLGWFLQSYLNRPIIMHTGSDTGFEAMSYIFPEDEISISILSNRDFSRTGRIVNAASEAIFGEPLKKYEVSAKYQFTDVYKKQGIEKAKEFWNVLKTDTTDVYFTNSDDILTTGAIINNSKPFQSKEILEFYNTLNPKSTYSWRLLGNANLNLGDTITAKLCYYKCLEINPEYEKAKIALLNIEK